MKTTREEAREALVPREADDHKGTFGHVLLIAGSRGMAGASILSARATLRSGTGLVTVAMPQSLQPVVAGAVPEAMTFGLSENSAGCLRPDGVSKLKALVKDKKFTTMAMGPGLSQNAVTANFVIHALSGIDLPAVIDADALNVLAAQDAAGVRHLLRQRKEPCIFTPHPGEMCRCLRISSKELKKNREGAAEKLAKQWHGVALLKGRDTVVSGGGKTRLNPTGGTGLSKGGSGDVLTGLIAGLWAQMLASGRARGDVAFWAAALGAYVHGAAADLAEEKLGPRGMTASDLVDHLPQAFKDLA